LKLLSLSESYLSLGGTGSSLLNPSLPRSQYVGIFPFPLISVTPLQRNKIGDVYHVSDNNLGAEKT